MALDAQEASRQVQQMVSFILNEAKDKAEEIDAKAMEDFNIEKLKILQSSKEKIRKDISNRIKKIETQRAIARSTAVNKGRLQKIEERNKALDKVIGSVQTRLLAVTKEKNKYVQLLVSLIVQGCMQLLEDDVKIRCKKEDVPSVEAAMPEAVKQYKQMVQQQAGVSKSVNLSIDKENLLPTSRLGGVVMCCKGGAIRVDNTLDARLRLLTEQDKPNIRVLLFPQ